MRSRSRAGLIQWGSSAVVGWEIDGKMKWITAHMTEAAALPLDQVLPW
jgi:hypothetical protein